jgi:hypothetical protein
MSTDPLLPIAPARVKALLLPLGKIKTGRFAEFVSILQGENVVRLGDISADGRPNRSTSSPTLAPIPKCMATCCPSPLPCHDSSDPEEDKDKK